MTREEAQFILGAYRPNSEDAHDPQFQEALALAQRDPELGRWFAEQQALDRAFAAKLRARPTPPDLKTQLLLARATIHHRAWWRRNAWLGLAACVAGLVYVGGSMLRQRARAAELSPFRAAMTAAAIDMTAHMDVMGLDTEGYKRWLAEHRGNPDFVLPPGLADKGIAACKIVSWQGHQVTMLCFKFSGRHVDLFVVNASELPGLSLSDAPAYSADGTMTSAAWRRDGKLYLLVGAMPKSELQALL